MAQPTGSAGPASASNNNGSPSISRAPDDSFTSQTRPNLADRSSLQSAATDSSCCNPFLQLLSSCLAFFISLCERMWTCFCPSNSNTPQPANTPPNTPPADSNPYHFPPDQPYAGDTIDHKSKEGPQADAVRQSQAGNQPSPLPLALAASPPPSAAPALATPPALPFVKLFEAFNESFSTKLAPLSCHSFVASGGLGALMVPPNKHKLPSGADLDDYGIFFTVKHQEKMSLDAPFSIPPSVLAYHFASGTRNPNAAFKKDLEALYPGFRKKLDGSLKLDTLDDFVDVVANLSFSFVGNNVASVAVQREHRVLALPKGSAGFSADGSAAFTLTYQPEIADESVLVIAWYDAQLVLKQIFHAKGKTPFSICGGGVESFFYTASYPQTLHVLIIGLDRQAGVDASGEQQCSLTFRNTRLFDIDIAAVAACADGQVDAATFDATPFKPS